MEWHSCAAPHFRGPGSQAGTSLGRCMSCRPMPGASAARRLGLGVAAVGRGLRRGCSPARRRPPCRVRPMDGRGGRDVAGPPSGRDAEPFLVPPEATSSRAALPGGDRGPRGDRGLQAGPRSVPHRAPRSRAPSPPDSPRRRLPPAGEARPPQQRGKSAPGGKATQALAGSLGGTFGDCCNSMEDPTIFAASSLPSDPRLLATVTSAYLGTRVYHDTLHVSGVYNGAGVGTHRAVLPSPLNVRLVAPEGTAEPLTQTFALDTNTGSFLHTLQGCSFRACQCLYAHRTLPHVLVSSVAVARLAAGPITVQLQAAFSPQSPDLDLHLGPDLLGARYLFGRTLTPEQPGGPQQEVHMLWTPVPPALTLLEGEEDRTWEFLTAVGSSQAEAQAWLTEALRLQAGGALYAVHARAWAQLWGSCGLDVAGPLPLRQALRSALYYLFSALPPPGALGHVSHGLSPGGLSNGSQDECYWGHVFWDQDLWMFPNILMFQPEAARAMLEYRIRTLGGALQNARCLGYQGAKFAWESAGSGVEVCPEDIYGTQEIHVNGAVVLAFELYYHTTQDLQLFQEAGGWEVVSAVAEFWCSRVEWSPEEENYHLKGVMSPDEYHSGVTNSVYTNVLVQNSLCFAAALAHDLGLPVPERWLEVADKIKVPFDPKQNFHPEFDGYEAGQEVKQADVVLLGYPVPFLISPEARRRNLEVYEAVTSPHGPAMTWSMFAVGWMELKDRGRARALLERSFANASQPFQVWTENADGSGVVNFLTGMGGFLQAALFGLTGFRVSRSGVAFDPMCPAGIEGLRVWGVCFQGSSLSFAFSEDRVTVEVTARAGPWAPPLEVELQPGQERIPLVPGCKVSFPLTAGRIQRSCGLGTPPCPHRRPHTGPPPWLRCPPYQPLGLLFATLRDAAMSPAPAPMTRSSRPWGSGQRHRTAASLTQLRADSWLQMARR
ncbi:protein-glucosylgalactosylhydroxylysine glucosidase [Tamandua tetradactyla]|uniref:protein-glucosylgalactosylhydroxylysine glucosidase n=1 Tax=Tamandua tetradactyla TaxID=48850 RepID=UPI004054964C